MDFTSILDAAGLSALAVLLPALFFATEKAVDLLSYYFPRIPARDLPKAALITGVIIAFAAYAITGESADTLQEVVGVIGAGLVAAWGAQKSHDLGDAAEARRYAQAYDSPAGFPEVRLLEVDEDGPPDVDITPDEWAMIQERRAAKQTEG